MIFMHEEVCTVAYMFHVNRFLMIVNFKVNNGSHLPDAVTISEVCLGSGVLGIGCDTLLEVTQGPSCLAVGCFLSFPNR